MLRVTNNQLVTMLSALDNAKEKISKTINKDNEETLNEALDCVQEVIDMIEGI